MRDERFELEVSKIQEREAAKSATFQTNANALTNLLLRMTDWPNPNHVAADYALKQHDRLERMFGKTPHGGIWIPFAGSRTIDAISGEAAIPSDVASELIPSLTPNSAVITNGARVINVKNAGKYSVPRANGGTVSITLDGDTATAGEPSFDQCVLTPFTLSATLNFSKRLSRQNTLANGIEQALSGDLQRRALAELDRIILAGTGSGEPAGILNNSDVARYAAGTNGAAPTLTQLADMEYELGAAYSGGALSWFTNSAMRRKLRKTPTAAGQAPLWDGKNELVGYRTNVTEHIPGDLVKGTGSNLSATILGDFSRVVVGFWVPAFEVLLNPFSTAGTASLTIFMDVGFGLLRNEAFINCVDFIA